MSADPDEKRSYGEVPAKSNERRPSFQLLGKKSPGVQRIEAISAHFGLVDRIFVFIGIFLIAYAYGLDGTIRYIYQVSIALSREPAVGQVDAKAF
jgi:SIT family siderophore-iron:H+ symporter-like MFS transporter